MFRLHFYMFADFGRCAEITGTDLAEPGLGSSLGRAGKAQGGGPS